MGKIICEKHGEQGIVMTCPHVRQDILMGTATIDSLVTATQEIESQVAFYLGYCDTCAKQYGVPLDGVFPESEFDNRSEQPVCSQCFQVFKESLRPY